MRFFRIRYKLFLAIAGLNACLVIISYGINSATLSKGFVHYLGEQQLTRLVPLMGALTGEYRHDGDWHVFAADPGYFHALARRYTGPEGGSPGFAGARDTEAPSLRPRHDDAEVPGPPRDTPPPWPRPAPLRPPPNLALIDAQDHVVVGPDPIPVEAVRAPLLVEGKTVGWLAYLPQRELVTSGESIFVEEQQRIFALVCIAMLVSSALMAFGISYWLSRPLKELTRGARDLTAGRFDTRIMIGGRDELTQLAGDFNRLAQTLADNLAARQRWIADIAHELRTPLAVLQGEIEALMDGIRPMDRHALSSLAQETARLTRLVEDLHTLSQSDQGSLSYRLQDVNPAHMLAGVAELYRHRAEAAGLRIELRLEEGLHIRGDPARLAQLFANLMQNSLRYTDAPGHLRITAGRVYNRVEVIWEDSSPGVPEGDLPHLTERLFRVEASRNRAGGGSGLGLSIAKAIAKAHDATMKPRHSVLGGLCWELLFPLMNTEEEA